MTSRRSAGDTALKSAERKLATRDRFYASVRQLPGVQDTDWKLGGQKVRGSLGVGLKVTNGDES
jgi:hypothetical protein